VKVALRVKGCAEVKVRLGVTERAVVATVLALGLERLVRSGSSGLAV